MAEILVSGKTTPSVLSKQITTPQPIEEKRVEEVPAKQPKYIFLGMEREGVFILHNISQDVRMYVSRDFLLAKYQSGEITNLPPEILSRIGAMPQVVSVELPGIAQRPTAAFPYVQAEGQAPIPTRVFYKRPEPIEPEIARAIKLGATHIVQYPGGRTEYVGIEKPTEGMKYYIEQEGIQLPVSRGVAEKLQLQEKEGVGFQYYKTFLGKEIPISELEYTSLKMLEKQKTEFVARERLIEERAMRSETIAAYAIYGMPTLRTPIAIGKALLAPFYGIPLEEVQRQEFEQRKAWVRQMMAEGPVIGIGKESLITGGSLVLWTAGGPLAKTTITKIGPKIPMSIKPLVKGIATVAGVGLTGGMIALGTSEIIKGHKEAVRGEVEGLTKITSGVALTTIGAIGLRGIWKAAFPPKPREETRILKPEEKEYVPEYGTEERKITEIAKKKHFEKPVVEKILSEERIYGKPTKEPIELKPYDVVVQKTTSKFARGIRQVGRETYLLTEEGVFKLEQPIDIERFISLGEKRPTILGLKPAEFAEYGEGIFFGKVKKLTIAPEEWVKEIISGRVALPKAEVFTRMIGVERPEKFIPTVVKGEPSGIFAWDVVKAPVAEPSLAAQLGIKDITHVGKFYLEPATGKIITEATVLGEKLIPTPIGYTTTIKAPAVTETIIYPPGVPSPNIFKVAAPIGIFGVPTSLEKITPTIVKLPSQAYFSKIGTITEKEQKPVVKIKPEQLILEQQRVSQISQPSTKQVEGLLQEELLGARVVPIGTTIQTPVLEERIGLTSRQITRVVPKLGIRTRVLEVPEPITTKRKKVKEIPIIPKGLYLREPTTKPKKKLILDEDLLYRKRGYPTLETIFKIKPLWERGKKK